MVIGFMVNFDKNVFGNILGDFSQTHLATLETDQNVCRKSKLKERNAKRQFLFSQNLVSNFQEFSPSLPIQGCQIFLGTTYQN
jgi:hypothetical protein